MFPFGFILFIYLFIYIYIAVHKVFWSGGGPRPSITSMRKCNRLCEVAQYKLNLCSWLLLLLHNTVHVCGVLWGGGGVKNMPCIFLV